MIHDGRPSRELQRQHAPRRRLRAILPGMPAFICRTCGVQQPDTAAPPAACAVCTDPRQYVGRGGQRWATLKELAGEGHRAVLRPLEPGLTGVGVEPSVGIGQRGLLVRTDEGTLLWDVPGFIDDDAVRRVRAMGGVAAVSASHPHFYGVIAEWADAFDAPVVLPRADRGWLLRPGARVERYDDRAEVLPGVTLVRTGGHFPGSAVAHWGGGAQGRGVLLTGDSVTVAADRAWVSVMWSYPNMIPLARGAVDAVAAALAPWAFDRLYGGWWGHVVARGAKDVVARSLARYRTALTDTAALEPDSRALGPD